jgi:hypothetical protein
MYYKISPFVKTSLSASKPHIMGLALKTRPLMPILNRRATQSKTNTEMIPSQHHVFSTKPTQIQIASDLTVFTSLFS